MSRESKFGYGFLLAGVGLPFLIDKVAGAMLPAIVAASVCFVVGVVLLVAAHLHRDDVREERSLMQTIGYFILIGGVIGGATGAIAGSAWVLVRKYRPDLVRRQTEVPSVGTQTTSEAPIPRFREKVESVTITVGTASMQRPVEELDRVGFVPFVLPGTTPLKIYREQHTTYVDVTLYGGTNKPPLEIRRNEFVDRTPRGWDLNHSDTAIEVVNENGIPIFQLIYQTASRIQINGYLHHKQGVLVATSEGIILNPTDPVIPPSPIFRYPSWKHKGVYRDDSSSAPPQQPAVTVTFAHVGYATVQSEPLSGHTIIMMAVTVSNVGGSTTVGGYSLKIVQGKASPIQAVRQPIPADLVLRAPNGAELKGEAASLERQTPLFLIGPETPVTGLLTFTSALPIDAVAKPGTELQLQYTDMFGKNYAVTHIVKPTVN